MKRVCKAQIIDDEGLDALYRATPPGMVRSAREIARAAKVNHQKIWHIEQIAMKKIREELERRGIGPEVLG